MGITVSLTATGTSDVTGSEAYQISHSLTTSSVLTARKVQIVVPTGSEVDILTFSATVTGLAVSAITKLLIVNRDATNFARIRVKDDTAHAYDVKLPADDWYAVNTRDLNVSATSGAFSSFSTADTVAAQADTGAVTLEIFVFHT